MKGWGIRCDERDMPAGTFLFEYVGEIINNKMCEQRLAEENNRVKKLNNELMKKRSDIRKRNERLIKKHEKVRAQLNAKLRRLRRSAANQNEQGNEGEVEVNESQRVDKKPLSRRDARKNMMKHLLNGRRCVDGGVEEDEEIIKYMEGDGPLSANFYFLTIGEDVIIDASKYGNTSRFINHSCNPNCHIEKWNVNGEIRVGIFTSKMVPKGTEFTIDYQFCNKQAQIMLIIHVTAHLRVNVLHVNCYFDLFS